MEEMTDPTKLSKELIEKFGIKTHPPEINKMIGEGVKLGTLDIIGAKSGTGKSIYKSGLWMELDKKKKEKRKKNQF